MIRRSPERGRLSPVASIARRRLASQQIAGPRLSTPAELVRWMGAVQAQDYPGALWAVGLRLSGAAQTEVEDAIAARTIVRTWPMRGTLHFVPAADVRWMLRLLASGCSPTARRGTGSWSSMPPRSRGAAAS